MIKVYRKTATIKAEQFDGSDEMINKYHVEFDDTYRCPFRIETLEGWLGVNVHDWITTGANGEHWPITDDVFKKMYAELPVIPKVVGEILQSAHGQDNLLGVLDTAKNGYKVSEALTWIIVNQNTFASAWVLASAWLDGYQVEE